MSFISYISRMTLAVGLLCALSASAMQKSVISLKQPTTVQPLQMTLTPDQVRNCVQLIYCGLAQKGKAFSVADTRTILAYYCGITFANNADCDAFLAEKLALSLSAVLAKGTVDFWVAVDQRLAARIKHAGKGFNVWTPTELSLYINSILTKVSFEPKHMEPLIARLGLDKEIMLYEESGLTINDLSSEDLKYMDYYIENEM